MHRYTLPKFLARTARTFGKVYKRDYQLFLENVVYGRFANAPKSKSLTYNYIRIIIRAIRVSHTQLRQFAGFVGDLKHFADYLIITYTELTLIYNIT